MKDLIFKTFDAGENHSMRYIIIPNLSFGKNGSDKVKKGLAICNDLKSSWVPVILGSHLGKEINFKDLPERTRNIILLRLEEAYEANEKIQKNLISTDH